MLLCLWIEKLPPECETMGCGGSRDSAGNSPASANHVIYDRKPKISVRIGDEVQRHNGSPTVIFIFGKSCFLALL